MKFAILTALIVAASSGAASAADAVITTEPAPAAYNWSGAYVGGQIGYGWGNDKWSFQGINYTVPAKPDGFLGGIYGGYNWQVGNGFVLGADADFTFSDMKESGISGDDGGAPDARYGYGSKIDWTAALRGRVGYGIDRFLPYVAGGVAFAHQNVSASLSAPFSESATRTGWTVGVGLDYAVTDNLIVRAEYRYSDFGKKTFSPVGWTPFDDRLSVNDIRVGIAYKF